MRRPRCTPTVFANVFAVRHRLRGLSKVIRIAQAALAGIVMLVAATGAAPAQPRNALVIGNGAYTVLPALKTPATDAAIVAETLQAAGYDVTELHDLTRATIGQTLRDFLHKLVAGGPDGTAFVYYSGYGAQWKGENYLIPVDAPIEIDADLAKEAFSLRDLLDELAATPASARIVILDAARDLPIGGAGRPPRQGLVPLRPTPGMLLAYSAAPGALTNDGNGEYSRYTGALVTAMRQPGLDIVDILKTAGLAVTTATRRAQAPWTASALTGALRLFDAPDQSSAPPNAGEPEALPPR
jgi:uncharacterized caspase-like protein